ncbi:MAG: MFS transporter [Actinomycetales bacterium]|nr:MFS transporter [Actinomycetales bacterium]
MPRLLADLTPLRVSADYRRIWAALSISNVGQQMTAVAVGIQVYSITHSSFAVGLVGLFQLVPLIGFGLYGGMLSDVHDRRLLGLITAAGLMACSVVLYAQSVAGLGSVALLYGVVAVQSAFFAVGNPARASIIPRLVGAELLPAANALGSLAWSIGFTLGPLLGGVVIAATGGVSAAYAVDVVAFTSVVYAMWRLRPIRPEGTTATRAGWAAVKDGITFLRGRKNLQMSFYVDMAAMVFGMPRALFPAIAAAMYPHDLRMAATAVGLLSAAPALGAAVSSVFSGPLGHVRRQGLAVVLAVFAWGLSIAVFGLVPWLPLACGLLAIAGAADNVSAVFRTTILQAATPDEFRGRLQGIFTVVVAGGPRLGDVESGTVAALAGETFAIVSGGIACIIVTAGLVAAMPAFLKYDARHPVP